MNRLNWLWSCPAPPSQTPPKLNLTLKIWKYFVHHVAFFIPKVVSWSQTADYKVKGICAEHSKWLLRFEYFVKFYKKVLTIFSSFCKTYFLGHKEKLNCDFTFILAGKHFYEMFHLLLFSTDKNKICEKHCEKEEWCNSSKTN